ncbi:hypothetical protein P9272_18535 [Mesorhizobium sp. WSM4976]|uniref:hypothetical protein n=1 Tax=Mesorhizobium sp. WSM4976 TaxID=3038549 RepID=UPI002417FE59|nr:hypothetical protein [Mesorhizobium sp. WSM4976]MDG4895571.1 hypothetical protein [Mesorhizobium sp. WSM4976]
MMEGAETGDAGEWISITEAAARLTEAGDFVERSTLSRYIKQHAEALPTRQDGKSNLVEFGALRQHRSENIRLKPASARQNLPARLQPGKLSPRFAGTQSDGLARKAQADAEMREMDLALRRGELTPTSEVDRAGRDAVALMQSAFERAVEAEAATLNVRYGWEERLVRIALKAFTAKGLEVFHREMLKLIDQHDRETLTDADPSTDRPGSLQ